MRRIDRLIDEARELEQRASNLREEARNIEKEEVRDREIIEHQRRIRRAAVAVSRGGNEFLEAENICAQSHLSQRDALRVIANELVAVKGLKLIQRNREIRRRALDGWTNQKIADSFGLTASHVSRVINHRQGIERCGVFEF